MTKLFNEKYYEHLTEEDLANEQWTPIEGFEGLYEISSCGRVRSLARTKLGPHGEELEVNERILKPTKNKTGYLHVILYKNKEKITGRLHRLVADAYLINPHSKREVNHLNEKIDNRVCSLEWVTREENIQHAYDNGLYDKQREAFRLIGINSAGENHGNCKLTDEDCDEIRSRYLAGGITQQQLADEYGVRNPHISRIINNKRRKRPTPDVQ